MRTILLTLSMILCFSVSAEKTYIYKANGGKPINFKVIKHEDNNNPAELNFLCDFRVGLSTVIGVCSNGIFNGKVGLTNFSGYCKIENNIKMYFDVTSGTSYYSGECLNQ